MGVKKTLTLLRRLKFAVVLIVLAAALTKCVVDTESYPCHLAASVSNPRRRRRNILGGEISTRGGSGERRLPHSVQHEDARLLRVGHGNEASSAEMWLTGGVGVTTNTDHKFVSMVALANAFFNALRPDPDIAWQARVPRVLWELSIALIASLSSSHVGGKYPSRRPDPTLHLLLSILTGSTALVDAFVWAPVFAIAADFQTCTGGGLFSTRPRVCRADYVKGIGRLLVSIQCVLTAVIYLATAVSAWGDFSDLRDWRAAERNAIALGHAVDLHSQLMSYK